MSKSTRYLLHSKKMVTEFDDFLKNKHIISNWNDAKLNQTITIKNEEG